MSEQPAHQEEDADPDKNEVGINFIDILFALVIGEALLALNRALQMPLAGVAHLVFAAVLTITSWIGYHLSSHRYIGIITFNLNKPAELIHLAKFSLDIVLVVLYWVAVQTTEWGFSGKGQTPSWRWTTAIALSVFGVYVLWDYLAWLGLGASRRGGWRSPRRIVSVIFFVIFAGVLAAAMGWNPRGNHGVATIDGILILATISYRVAKDTSADRCHR